MAQALQRQQMERNPKALQRQNFIFPGWASSGYGKFAYGQQWRALQNVRVAPYTPCTPYTAVGAVKVADLVDEESAARRWTVSASPRLPVVSLTSAEPLPAHPAPKYPEEVKSKLSTLNNRKVDVTKFGSYVPAPIPFLQPLITTWWFDAAGTFTVEEPSIRRHQNAKVLAPGRFRVEHLEKKTTKAQLRVEVLDEELREVWRGASVPDYLLLEAGDVFGSFEDLLLALQLALIYEQSDKETADKWSIVLQLLLAASIVELMREARRQALAASGAAVPDGLLAATLVAFVPKGWRDVLQRDDAAKCRAYRVRWANGRLEIERSDRLTIAELLDIIAAHVRRP